MPDCRRLLISSLIVVMLFSCSAMNPELSQLESSYQGISQLDLKIGFRASRLMQARYQLIHNSKIKNYITEIRQALLINTRFSPDLGEIILINDPTVLAFTVPNGDIFLSRGMLLLAENEAEIAAVIAHELGHLLSNHPKKSRELEAGLKSMLAGVSTSDDAPNATMLDSLASIVDYGNSRKHEIEADQLMRQLMQRSVYPAPAILDIYHRLLEQELNYAPPNPSTHRTQAFDTHPDTQERIILLANKLGNSGISQTDKQRFQARYQKLVHRQLSAGE